MEPFEWFAAGGLALFGAARTYYERHGFHLPGHQYLGPGTDLENAGDPLDHDDNIARDHDQAYSAIIRSAREQGLDPAQVFKAIGKADTKAIDKFYADYKKTGNWHSLLGQLGLQAKSSIENIVGQVYPHQGKWPLRQRNKK